ncbi:LOW QUALITY PROTEIN: hypothetical protein CH63R_05205 [Colletotrichum higginsianum IMI 349063]|uniref:Uncharacterized protein n=1 Tax=Colletotrichum higginsianum (strain IMI 349063) TaxID=759273 RepID=A0A1B7YLI7_COLHI|nr:LOW QUALITY PROTEIN: hypothetical protein CH63R_05205 [Colletotrichum higginsianum IMI 349063]OBR12909.1 LOW QUALITY PROTEIN: hypothetical protein CH63R_05205 [Colletotrichum higginsianum IMI 349063]
MHVGGVQGGPFFGVPFVPMDPPQLMLPPPEGRAGMRGPMGMAPPLMVPPLGMERLARHKRDNEPEEFAMSSTHLDPEDILTGERARGIQRSRVTQSSSRNDLMLDDEQEDIGADQNSKFYKGAEDGETAV